MSAAERMAWWIIVSILVALAVGCSATPRVPTMTGPSTSPETRVAPEVTVTSEGPAEVAVETVTETAAEAAVPELTLAPVLEAMGDIQQEITVLQEAIRRSEVNQNSAVAGLAERIGQVHGDLNSVMNQFDISKNQLEERIKQMELHDAQQQRWIDLLVQLLIGVGGGVLIAAGMDGPPSVKAKMILIIAGLATMAAAVLPSVL